VLAGTLCGKLRANRMGLDQNWACRDRRKLPGLQWNIRAIGMGPEADWDGGIFLPPLQFALHRSLRASLRLPIQTSCNIGILKAATIQCLLPNSLRSSTLSVARRVRC